MNNELIVGIDAGTSVVKAVAFQVDGEQVAVASVRNRYKTDVNGAATQNPMHTWQDCVQALKDLSNKVPEFAQRVVALSVTGQGDGTWLIDHEGNPVTDAWLWLDGRSAATVDRLRQHPNEWLRFKYTGTGLNTCQQGVQLAHMSRHCPDLLANACTAFHCKDWLYFNLTGVRATDPSEASFTFGDFRSREYCDDVLSCLGITHLSSLLPPILDGSQHTHPLSAEAARLTGLKAGIPVSLGYVDMVMTALGAGVHTSGDRDVACSVIGSTGVHMRSVNAEAVFLNKEGTGYVIPLPIANQVTQVQTNMASALNLDWLLDTAAELLAEFGLPQSRADLVAHVENWLAKTTPGQLLYHPYISAAGERGPFVNAMARAGFTGLTARHRYPDLVRAVVEGLGMAMRDCYQAMGPLPTELRLSGGAVRSARLRGILGASIAASVKVSAREEAGAAGAAMMSAVAIGAFPDMESCIDTWVAPLLGDSEDADRPLSEHYARLFQVFQKQRQQLPDTWCGLDALRDDAITHTDNHHTGPSDSEFGSSK